MTVIWAGQALLEKGWARDVAIKIDGSGHIESVTPGSAPAGNRYGIILPSPVNVHSHAFQRSMAGLTEKRGPDPLDSFWTWRQLMFRFLDRLTPDHVEAITAFVQMEMMEAGYSTNVEFHYLHHQPGGVPYANLAEMSDRIIAAASRTGIGLTLLPVHYQYGGLDKRELGAGQVRFGNDFERFVRLHEMAATSLKHLPPDSTIGVAPHSMRAVAPGDIARARALGGPLHMHLAEQVAEVEEVEMALGMRPVEWVLENMAPDQNFCFIHCTQMEPHETAGLARSGAVAGLCPITESSLGDGIFDGIRWMGEGGAIAIGSDSNIRISLSEEMRTLDYSQRLRDRSRAALATAEYSTGRRIFDAINAGGAKAAGRKTGRIAPGMLADLMALDAGHVDLAGRGGDALLDSYIFAGDDRMVTNVWSAGRLMVRDGRHVLHDEITSNYLHAIREIGEAI